MDATRDTDGPKRSSILVFYLVVFVVSSLAIVSVALPSAFSATLSAPQTQPVPAKADGNIWFPASATSVNQVGKARVFATFTYFLFQVSASPTTQTITQGQSVTYEVSVVHTGSAQQVQLAVIVPVGGLSSAFSPPSSGTPDFSSTLTISYPSSSSITPGSYPLTIQAYSPNCSSVCDPSQKNPTTITVTLVVQQQTTTTTSPTVTTTYATTTTTPTTSLSTTTSLTTSTLSYLATSTTSTTSTSSATSTSTTSTYTTVTQTSMTTQSYFIPSYIIVTYTTRILSAATSTIVHLATYTGRLISSTSTTLTQTTPVTLTSVLPGTTTTTTTKTLSSITLTTESTTSATTVPSTLVVPTTQYSTTITSTSTSTSTTSQTSTTSTSTTSTTSTTSSLLAFFFTTTPVTAMTTVSLTVPTVSLQTIWNPTYTISVEATSYTGQTAKFTTQSTTSTTSTSTTTISISRALRSSSTTSTTSTSSSSTSTITTSQTSTSTKTSTSISTSTTTTTTSGFVPAARCSLSVTLGPTTTGTTPLTVTFYAFVTNTQSSVSYVWNFGDNSQTANDFLITHTYQNPGNYIVLVQALDANGCVASSFITIGAQVIPEFSISVFAAFAVGLVLVLTFSKRLRPKMMTP